MSFISKMQTGSQPRPCVAGGTLTPSVAEPVNPSATPDLPLPQLGFAGWVLEGGRVRVGWPEREGSLEKDGSSLLMRLAIGNVLCVQELPAQPGLELERSQLHDYQLMRDN